MRLNRKLTALMASLLCLVCLTTSPAFSQSSPTDDQLPLVRDSTSDEILQECGPETGIMLVLYYKSEDPSGDTWESSIQRAVASNPNWINSIRLRKVNADADTDKNSCLTVPGPMLLMTVTGADGRLRVLNVSFDNMIFRGDATKFFIAQGIENMNHPPQLPGPVNVHYFSKFEDMGNFMVQQPSDKTAVLYYNSRGYLSLALKNIFEMLSTRNPDLSFVALDVAGEPETASMVDNKIPTIGAYQRSSPQEGMVTFRCDNALLGFNDPETIEANLRDFISSPEQHQVQPKDIH